MGRRRNTPDFNRSNRIHTIRIRPTGEERSLTQKLIASDRASLREAYGQRLLNFMCERLRIPPARLRVQDVHQPHKKQSGRLAYKEYGAYYLDEQVIVIANLTAVRGKVVAGKTFFDTLIHEFMHHLDRTYLQISSTPHSAGFYNRIDDLKRKLMGGGPAETQADRGRWEKPPKGLLAALDQAARVARQNEATEKAEPPNRPETPGGQRNHHRDGRKRDSLFPPPKTRIRSEESAKDPAGSAPRPAKADPEDLGPPKQLSLELR